MNIWAVCWKPAPIGPEVDRGDEIDDLDYNPASALINREPRTRSTVLFQAISLSLAPPSLFEMRVIFPFNELFLFSLICVPIKTSVLQYIKHSAYIYAQG